MKNPLAPIFIVSAGILGYQLITHFLEFPLTPPPATTAKLIASASSTVVVLPPAPQPQPAHRPEPPGPALAPR